MKTSNVMKWSVGAAVLLGLGMVAMGTASAAEDDEGEPGEGLTEVGVRHGIRYDGCQHFELVDAAAVEAWGRSNAWKFVKWLPKLDEVREDPEPALTEAMAMLFPECSWPPGEGTTFGPERLGWAEAMAAAKEAIQDLELARVGGRDGSGGGFALQAGALLGRALALGLRTRPVVGWRPRG